MNFGLDVPIHGPFADPGLLADLDAEAEQTGWDGFFVQDSLLSEQALTDPWIALAAIAMRTKRVRVGALLTALARRHPWQVARQTVALDHLSNGRLVFGAGLGFKPEEFSATGQKSDATIRAERLDEALEILTGLWSAESFSYEGKHYLLDLVRFLPGPTQSPRIPIWIGGFWPNRRPFRRAARWDGVYIGTLKVNGKVLTPAELREVVAYIRERREGTSSFQVAFAGEKPVGVAEAADVIGPYEEAGVTWWLEGLWGSIEQARDRILDGPPGLC